MIRLGQFYKFLIICLLALSTFIAIVIPSCGQSPFVLSSQAIDPNHTYIHLDQFGYRPQEPKLAVIGRPAEAKGGESALSVDILSDRYQVIEADTQNVIYEENAEIWQEGMTDSQSGDQAAWFDFSSIREPGNYIVRNGRTGEVSGIFEIGDDVYREVLIAATKMFFYQRSGFEKKVPYADARWTDTPAFMGPGQDTEARFVNDKSNADLARDMRGGWFDAGDTNKYVTFAAPAVHQLIDAYTENPSIWTDDFNIPESGNGIPDLLDEVIYELDWLMRMQDDDGGAFIKIGTLDYDFPERPGLDTRPRYYAPKCSSATIYMAGMFAHASLFLKDLPQLESYTSELGERAIKAWDWYQRSPREENCDTQEIKAGDADQDLEKQNEATLTAAIYLYALSEDSAYGQYITDHYNEVCPFCAGTWYPYHSAVGDALLFYTTLDSSVADANVQESILTSFSNLSSNNLEIYGLDSSMDPYRAYMPDDQYHWGSNAVKANLGLTNYDAITFNKDTVSKEDFRTRALDTLHYFHGVNPLGLVYLTNMYDYGAEKSLNEIYHDWFGQGIYDNARTSPSGPAPGYLSGGPNKNYTGSADIPTQYPMKAYLDSNNKTHDMHMWEISEPAIYYQSAYLKLLSRFAS